MSGGSYIGWRRDSDDVSEVEGDHVEKQIAQLQEEHLLPLKEDVADWVGKTLGIESITVENFMSSLDTGVLLCKLVRLIQQRAEEYRKLGLVSGPVPSMKFKCWENAKPQSFYARDNAENFLRWCRRFGVHEAVIFESDGLVLHTQPRTVVLCLLELGRIASRYGVEPPGLVKLEKEIEEEYGEDSASNCSSTTSSSPIPLCRSRTESAMSVGSSEASRTRRPSGGSSNRSTPRSSPNRNSKADIPPRYTPSELDKKIMNIAESTCEDTSQIKRISEGRYKISGKTVYIRLLKGRHVMVRVGGGWDTLEHYLSRHEPCHVTVVNRRASDVSSLHRPLSPRSSYPGSSTANGRPVSASAALGERYHNGVTRSTSFIRPSCIKNNDTPKSSKENNGIVSRRASSGAMLGSSRGPSSGALIGSTTRAVSPDSFLQIKSKYRSSTTGKPVTSSMSFSGYSSGRSSISAGSRSSTSMSQVSSVTSTTGTRSSGLNSVINSAGNMRPSVARRASMNRKSTSTY